MSNKLKFLVILCCSFFMSFAFASDSENENLQQAVPTHLLQSGGLRPNPTFFTAISMV